MNTNKRIESLTSTYVQIVRKIIVTHLDNQKFDFKTYYIQYPENDYYDIIAEVSKMELNPTIEIHTLIEDEVDVTLCVGGIEIDLDIFDTIEKAKESAKQLLQEISKYNYVVPSIVEI